VQEWWSSKAVFIRKIGSWLKRFAVQRSFPRRIHQVKVLTTCSFITGASCFLWSRILVET